MQIKVRLDSRLTQRWARLFSKQTLLRAARVMGPTLVALTFAGVAHAQGTMDFSGAQTLMGTFKTFAIYAGAVICFGGLIFCGNPHDEWAFSRCYTRPLRRAIRRRSARLGSRMDRTSSAATFTRWKRPRDYASYCTSLLVRCISCFSDFPLRYLRSWLRSAESVSGTS